MKSTQINNKINDTICKKNEIKEKVEVLYRKKIVQTYSTFKFISNFFKINRKKTFSTIAIFLTDRPKSVKMERKMLFFLKIWGKLSELG